MTVARYELAVLSNINCTNIADPYCRPFVVTLPRFVVMHMAVKPTYTTSCYHTCTHLPSICRSQVVQYIPKRGGWSDTRTYSG